MKFLDLEKRLVDRKQRGLLRKRKLINSPQQPQIICDNKTLINFASNDYLSLANNSKIANVLQQSQQEYGFGSGASHMICGHQPPHKKLEKTLAKFTQRDSTLLFSSGYMANLAILQSLSGKGDVIVADKLNHASLIDGVKLSQADSVRYPHCDMVLLDKRLSKGKQNKFVVTDSVFSMDGDIAPLKEIVRLCEKYHAILIVDDAHGFGVLGEYGRGCIEHFDLDQKKLPVLMGTLGKAIGGYGAFVAGEKKLIKYLTQTARSYIYTTAMPACVAAANLENLKALIKYPERNRNLKSNISYFRKFCNKKNIPLLESITAIQPIIIGDNQTLLDVNKQLLNAGIMVGAIRPPSVPNNTARLRITLSAMHSKGDIDYLISQLFKLKLDKLEVNRND